MSDTPFSVLPALEVIGLSKSFGQNQALDKVHLSVQPGEVHALLGMNGSGKSTLVKILSGFHSADSGSVTVGPNPQTDETGIVFVHQDLGLIEEMTVIENMVIGRQTATKHGMIDWKAERARARAELERFELADSLDVLVGNLSRAEATVLAIARALAQSAATGASLLVLDEPTSALPRHEASELLRVIRRCAADGLGILFITHRLREVEAACDRVSILRNGRLVHEGPASEISIAGIASAMTGSTNDHPSDQAPNRPVGDPVLIADDLWGGTVKGLSLRVGSGEIVGVVGLLGSGIDDLGYLLSGRRRATSGRVEIDGLLAHSPKVRPRVGYVPANRPAQSLLTGLSARENVTVGFEKEVVSSGRISLRQEQDLTKGWFEQIGVYPKSTEYPIEGYSGGNQQKVIFARWLMRNPLVIVADEPTQGVDIHAKAQILERLRHYSSDGLGVVFISGDPDEISAGCDRIIVLRDGSVCAEFTPPFRSEEMLSVMHEDS